MRKVWRNISVFLTAFFLSFNVHAGDGDLIVKFDHCFGEKKFLVDSLYFNSTGDSIIVSSLKYYISGIRINYLSGQKFEEANSYHLINPEVSPSLTINLETKSSEEISSISFNLGIDSITNVSGVFGGDLDPTKGMYWAWQSGYINFKTEGFSNRCSSVEKNFQFHIGGYQYPYNTLNSVVLDVNKSGDIIVLFDVKKFFDTIDLASLNKIMSPSEVAMQLSLKAAESFMIKAQ